MVEVSNKGAPTVCMETGEQLVKHAATLKCELPVHTWHAFGEMMCWKLSGTRCSFIYVERFKVRIHTAAWGRCSGSQLCSHVREQCS